MGKYLCPKQSKAVVKLFCLEKSHAHFNVEVQPIPILFLKIGPVFTVRSVKTILVSNIDFLENWKGGLKAIQSNELVYEFFVFTTFQYT